MKEKHLPLDFRISILYLLFGGVWILISDTLTAWLVSDPEVLTRIQTYKGWLFIAASALLIFALLRRELRLRNIAAGELAESEERYRQLFEHSMDAILLTSPDGSIHDTNPAACAMFGLTEGEIKQIGRNGLVDVNDPRLKAALEERAQTGKFHGELIFLRKGGDKFEGELSTNLFVTREGADRTSMIIRDISARRRMENALRESEQKYSAIFNKAPYAAALAKFPEGTFIEVNEEFIQIFGYSRPEVIGKTSLELGMYPNLEDRKRSVSLIDAQGSVRNLEMKLRTKTGELRDFLVSTDMIGVGDSKYVITTAKDITERKQAEAALRRNEEVLRLFVEHTPAAIAMLDRDMKYLAVSRRFLADYELGEQKIIGRSHYDIFPEIPERWREIHRRCLAGAVEKADEDPFPRASGKMDWVRWEIHPWYEGDGEIGGVILFSEVITQRKQAEEALRKRYKEIAAVYEASQRLQKLRSPELVAQEVIEVLELTVEYTYSAVLLVDQSRGLLEPFALSDQKKGEAFIQYDKDFIRSKGVRFGTGVTGWVAEHGESQRIGNVNSDPRYLSMRDNIHSELCVPLRVQDHVIGVVNVESTQPNAYTAEDQLLLETVATHISVAIQNSRLIEELRLSRDRLADLSRRLVEAHETERRALGRELHDQIGQMLTAMKIILDMSRQLPPEAARQKVAQAQELVSDLLNRISRISLELRPPMLDDIGLVHALVWQVSRYQEQAGIQVDFKHAGIDGKRFSSEVETTAYRVIQEALTNVARHAHARHVRLKIENGDGWMEIRIEDDGAGFDPSPALAKNHGLGGMRERVQLVGGEFEIGSESNKGSWIRIRMPSKEEIQ